jgi:hypothetical protein
MSYLDEVRASTGSLTADFNTWGRQTFHKSYSSGGIASYAFSPAGKNTRGVRVGTSRYNSRLENIRNEIVSSGGNTTKIDKSIASSRKAPGILRRNLWGLGGIVSAGFVLTSVLSAEDGPANKLKAGVGGLASGIGFDIGSGLGMKAGALAGALAGSVVPVIGTAIGAAIGGVAGFLGGGFLGSSAGEKMATSSIDFLDSRVDKSRKARTMGWRRSNAAFSTQAAYTMRSASLQMMNQGMLSARSGLGHEGVMMHQ